MIAESTPVALIGSATFLETFAGVLLGQAIANHCAREPVSSTYRRYLDGGAPAWLIEAGVGGAPVGYSLLAKTDLPGSAPDGSDLELKRIYTLSRFHGGGIGRALMQQQAVDYVEEQGHHRLVLGVFAGNDRARAFYTKHGFRHIADRKFRVGDREYDDVVLAKVVGSAHI